MRSAVRAARVEQDNGGGNRLLHQDALVDGRERLAAEMGLPPAREGLNCDKTGPAAFQVGESL